MKRKISGLLAVTAALLAGTWSTAEAKYGTPTVDGTGISTANYTQLAVQSQASGYGTSVQLWGLYAANDDKYLYLAVSGNLASGNAINVFIDNGAGGTKNIAANPNAGYTEFDDLATGSNGNMPTGFGAEFVLNIKGSTDTGLWDLRTNAAAYKGNTGSPSTGYAYGMDNSNALAVASAASATTGLEIRIPLSDLGVGANDTIRLFAIGGDANKGGNPATYFSNQTLPASGASNYGNDGAGGAGGNGLNYNGTGGPSISPLSYSIRNVNTNWVLSAPQALKTASISSVAITSNVATVTTTAAHNFKIGEQVYVDTGAALFDTWRYTPSAVTTVPSSTTFTFARTAQGNVPATTVSGSATVNWLGLVFDNRGMAYNDATGHVLVARGVGTSGSAGVHILDNDGTDLGELKMGADISNKSLTTNVATITTSQAHGLAVNQQVLISCNPPDTVFDGVVTVTGTPTTDTLTYAKTNANVASTATSGTTNIFIGGGGASLDKIRTTPSGGIYGCNLSLSTTSLTDVFTVYHWSSESAVPIVIQRNTADSIASSLTVTNKSLTTNVATITVASTTGLVVGMPVTVALSPADSVFDGTFTTTGITATTITYAKTNANVASTASAGTVVTAVPTFSKGARLPAATSLIFRFGDTLDVVANGSGPGASVQIYSAKAVQGGAGVDRVLKLNFTEGSTAVSSSANIALVGGNSAAGNLPAGGLWVDGFNGDLHISTSGETAKWTNDGLTRTPTLYATNPGDQASGVLVSNSGGRGVTIGAEKFFAFIDRGCGGHPDVSANYQRGAVADISNGFASARYVFHTGSRQTLYRPNTNGTGDVAWDNQTSRPRRFFAMPTNQYIGSYTVPATVAASTKTWDGGASTNKWGDAANWNPDGVPTTDHDVVLDHTNVAGAYTVQISGLDTYVARTVKVDGGNTNNIKLLVSGDGEPIGATPWLANGNGKNDIQVTGTYRRPVSKDDNNAPRFRIEVLKGLSYVTQKSLTSNVATIILNNNLSGVNGLATGDSVTIALSPADAVFDGTYTLTGATTSGTNTTITYAKTNANVAATGAYGTCQPAVETFRWNNIGSTSTFANGAAGIYGQAGGSGVTISTSATALSDGYSVAWASATGHTTGDVWLFNPNVTGNNLNIKGDGTAAYDLEVKNGGSLELYSAARFSSFPGPINNWGGGNKSYFGANGTYILGNGNLATGTTGAMWPSDWTTAPASLPTYDGATTWDADASYVADLYPAALATVPQNIPSLFRSFRYGKVICRNSWGQPYTAGYGNTGNNTHFSCSDLILEAGTTFTVQTNSTWDLLINRNLTNQGTGALSIDGQASTTVGAKFAGTTTVSRTSTGTVSFPSGFTVNSGASVQFDMPVTFTKVQSVNGTLTANAALTVNDFASNDDVQVNSGGKLVVNNGFPLSGAGQVNVKSGSTLEVKDAAGITASGATGAIQVSGTRTFDSGATYIYSGAAAQATGAALPSTVAGLTVNNASNVTLTNPVTATNLVLTAGEAIGNATATNVSRTSGFVRGTLTRPVDATSTNTLIAFPVGTTGAYSPASVTLTGAGSGTGTIAVAATATAHPSAPNGSALKRFWTLTPTGISGFTATNVFNYLDGDLPAGGSEAALAAARYTGSAWQSYLGTSINTGANSATVTGVTAFSPWTLFENPDINLPSSNVAFGYQSSSTNQNLNVENVAVTTSATLNIASVTYVSGSTDFSINSFPATIAGGANANIVVTYNPTLSGAQSATFQINSDDPDEPAVTFTVSGTKCSSTFNSASTSVDENAHPGQSVGVTSNDGSCGWTVSNVPSWITITGGSGTGSGNGTVNFDIASNPGGPRSVGLTLPGGSTYTVNQDGLCTYTVQLATYNAPAAGANDVLTTVTTSLVTCPWTATPNAAWVTVDAPGTGVGNGTFTYDVAANTGIARSTTITVGTASVTVNQPDACVVGFATSGATITRFAQTGLTAAVTTSNANCPWTASTVDSWITITTNSGTGSGNVVFDVTANPVGTSRVGTITIGSATYTVTQDPLNTTVSEWQLLNQE